MKIIVVAIILLFLSPSAGLAVDKTQGKLSLADCIALTLRKNRTIRNAHLDRVADKFRLRVAEDKFTPQLNFTPYLRGAGEGGSGSGPTTISAGAGVDLNEQLPTGGSLGVTLYHDTSDSDESANQYGWDLNLSQPLLKGAGLAVGTASVRQARAEEKIYQLSCSSIVIDTLTTVVYAYRAYGLAMQSLAIQRQSLQWSRQLVAINREMIAAGRMAAVEMVQSEAEVADREYALLVSENSLDAARLALNKAIDIEKRSRIEPLPENTIPSLPFPILLKRPIIWLLPTARTI